MKCEESTSLTSEEFNPPAAPQEEEKWPTMHGRNRKGPRFAYPVRTSVELPFLPTKEYGVCDFSRSGMFLAFTDMRATRSSLEENSVVPGAHLVVRFTVSLPDETHCCRIQARLVRITPHGIGVRFTPRNSWQLTVLTDLLTRAHGDPKAADSETASDEDS